MNRFATRNIVRFLVYAFVQVVLFKRISIGFEETYYIHFYIYPIIILLLPFKTPRSLVIFLGFVLGLLIDVFYDSPGVHAATCVLTAYLRDYILLLLKPTEGYKAEGVPVIEQMGIVWCASYFAIAMIAHLLVYYSIEAFSFVYLDEIILKTLLSFLASFFIVIITQLLVNPKY